MPPKAKSDNSKPKKSTSSKAGKTSDNKSDKSDKSSSVGSSFTDISSNSVPPRNITLSIELHGIPSSPEDFIFVAMLSNTIITNEQWEDGMVIEPDIMPLNLNDPSIQVMILSNPIIILLRARGGKPVKEQDLLLDPQNRAGGTVDLLPLLLGEEEVFTRVRLVSIATGEYFGCDVTIRASASGMTDHKRVPLLLTMMSVHCMPLAREGTVYISAIGLDDIHIPKSLNFGQSLSTPAAKKLVWATTSGAGQGANTAYNVPDADKFIPEDLDLEDTDQCFSFYWNAINRVLVDVEELTNRLSSPFLIEMAGVQKSAAKPDVRGRYMGWVDARALLEPGQIDVTVCTKLFYYSEDQVQNVGPLLDLPPTSAKTVSARETDAVLDDSGHNAYAVIRFDLMDALVPKAKYVSLYDVIGFPPPEDTSAPVDQLDTNATPEEPIIEARFIRKSGAALAVHEELSEITFEGTVPMNKGIKRSAAHLLLTRVRTMLKNFPPGESSSLIDWQDTVTGQHAASRRAVTASFAPQPPKPRLPERVAATRCRTAGDERLAQKHMMTSLKVAGTHPRSLICKTLRCLEERNDLDANNYLFEALNSQVRNRYLLWILGAQEFDKGAEEAEVASAAFRIAVKGDYSDGTTNAIAWAALHTFHHCNGNIYGAHIAARKMRKSYLLREWKKFLKCWTDASGMEEVYWNPAVISSENPILMAAAFFLCLRCYKFSEKLLHCVEKECATRGSDELTYIQSVDVYYVRIASFILRDQLDDALEMTRQGIQRYGPSALMAQMRLNVLTQMRNWDHVCEKAYNDAEKAGVKVLPSILYKAALSRFQTVPRMSLQRAARAHKLAPSGHTALLIGRIYAVLREHKRAERWCAGAVKTEPLLADGWAMLSILAMYERNLDKARTMLRTARQVGPISEDIERDLKKVMAIVELDQLPDSLVKGLCIKKAYDSDIARL